MSLQHDSVAFSANKDKIIITCACGDVSHGIIQFQINPEDDHFYLSFCAVPYAWKLRHRIRNAFRVFRGMPVNVDLFIDKTDAETIGQWMIGKINV